VTPEDAFLHPVPGASESAALCRFHTRNGYSHFRGVFTAAEIAALRAGVDRAFAESQPQRIDQARFLTAAKDAPELACVLRHPGLVRSLSTILGDDYLHCDEFGVHADFYSSGWHCDTSSPSNAGHDFFWDPNFNVVQVAIYLQPNDPANGGGLDVIPGSHMRDDPFCRARTWLLPHEAPPPPPGGSLLSRIKRRLAHEAVAARSRGVPIPWVRPDRRARALARATTIMSGVGDVVAFNLRVGHRSTPAPPDARGKRALFFVCGANNRATRSYGQWLERYSGEARRSPCSRDAYLAGFGPPSRPEPLGLRDGGSPPR
jgi:hypothetical protein